MNEIANIVPTPIMALFLQWQELSKQMNEPHVHLSDEELDVLADKALEIEDRIIAMPSTNAADFAIKLVIYTAYGGFTLVGAGGKSPVLDEAKVLIAQALPQ